MNQSGESCVDDRAIWKDYIDGQEFEHALIDRKTTWWLSAQAILFTAYGLTFQAAVSPVNFQHIIALVGVAVASLTWIGVAAVIFSKFFSWRLYRRFFCSDGHSPPHPLDQRPLQLGRSHSQHNHYAVARRNTAHCFRHRMVISAQIFIMTSYYAALR
jgi:hypothetical protein